MDQSACAVRLAEDGRRDYTISMELMTPTGVTQLILEYRWWILVPLAIIEGPIVALVAGTLAAVGYFNIYVLCVFFFIRDVGMDLVYYAVGHYGGRTAFVDRMMKKIGVTADHLSRVHDLWERRPGMAMLVGKLAYALSIAFIVVAGVVRMNLGKFIWYGSLVAVLQYGILLFAGYFFGASMGDNILHILENIQYVIAFIALAIIAYYLISWRMRQKFLKEGNTE